jgi:hypothetical protein
MTTENFLVALRAFCRRRRFVPFLLELVTGEPILVRHPEAVSMRRDVVYFRETDGRVRLFDAASVCQLRDPPPATPST